LLTSAIDYLKDYLMPVDARLARIAFQQVLEGNITELRKHPLWELSSPDVNRTQFARLQQYGNNFMLLMAVD